MTAPDALVIVPYLVIDLPGLYAKVVPGFKTIAFPDGIMIFPPSTPSAIGLFISLPTVHTSCSKVAVVPSVNPVQGSDHAKLVLPTLPALSMAVKVVL